MNLNIVLGARQAGLSIQETVELLGFFHTTTSRPYREWSKNIHKYPVSGICLGEHFLLMSEVRLLQADMKEIVTQTLVTIKVCKRAVQTMKQTDYSSRTTLIPTPVS